MKIALAQQNYIIGDFDGNRKKIIDGIKEAERLGADIVAFSELCVCGYPPRDFLEFSDFIRRCEESVNEIAKHTTKVAALVGAPYVNPVAKGKDLFNASYFLHERKIQHVVFKTLLPTYDVFDEVRYFESGDSWGVFNFKGKKLAITVCEDLWNIGDNPLYRLTPIESIVPHEPEFLINLSASPFDYNHAKDRINVLRDVALKHKLPVFYCNCVGAQTELIFDGGSLVVNSNGFVADEMSYFNEEIKLYDLHDVEQTKQDHEQPKDKIELIHRALVFGIKEYFSKLNFTKTILGLSGGMDSALVTVLAAEALGAENVLAVLMPSEFSSDHSVNDSVKLCENLGVPYKQIPIKQAYNSLLETLTPHFDGKPFDVTEENLQARSRGMILMALANKHRFILLNTTNKSEAAVGYGTLYGDLCGGLAVLGDVYKTEVYKLAAHINRTKEIIP
ncbi:MAG TPA: NAD+ synthase, partial [Chitinophagales bacterium]|nr:NAD+ synthase [Chitinophagales bacterium]